jgi:thioredoxin 1
MNGWLESLGVRRSGAMRQVKQRGKGWKALLHRRVKKGARDMSNELECVQLTDDNFKMEVLESSEPVLVEFTKESYAGHHIIAPMMQEVIRDYRDRVKVSTLDVDQAKETARHYRIREIPTVLFFRKGVVVAYLIGIFRKKELTVRLQLLLEQKP